MLLDEIIELATDNKQPITVLLRKCLVLASQLKNARLKSWATQELNGYSEEQELPSYRTTPAQAFGNFNGPFGAAWRDYPIPPAILEENHRPLAEHVELRQALSAYEDLVTSGSSGGQISAAWPTNLVLYYSNRLPTKGMVLVSAYQEIPRASLVEVLDTVRNRVLTMALEIQETVGESDEDLRAITPQEASIVERTIINNLGSGSIYVSTDRSTMTIQQQSLSCGNWEELEKVLRLSGITAEEVEELSNAVKEDNVTLGTKVRNWIQKAGSNVISSGIKVGTTIGQALLTEYLKQYFGLK